MRGDNSGVTIRSGDNFIFYYVLIKNKESVKLQKKDKSKKKCQNKPYPFSSTAVTYDEKFPNRQERKKTTWYA